MIEQDNRPVPVIVDDHTPPGGGALLACSLAVAMDIELAGDGCIIEVYMNTTDRASLDAIERARACSDD
jgi:hypothetical protein